MSIRITVWGDERNVRRFLKLIPGDVEVKTRKPGSVSLVLKKEHYPFILTLVNMYNLKTAPSRTQDTVKLTSDLLKENLSALGFLIPFILLTRFLGEYFPLLFLFSLSSALVKKRGVLKGVSDILEGLPEGALLFLFLLIFSHEEGPLLLIYCFTFSFFLPLILAISLGGRKLLSDSEPIGFVKESLYFSFIFSFPLYTVLSGGFEEFLLTFPFLVIGAFFLSALLLKLYRRYEYA